MAELKDTWDLTHMFESVQAWRDGMDEARTMADELAAMQGTITKNADTLYLALKRNDKLGEKLTALFVYAKMYFDQNMANGEAKDIYESADSIYTAIAEKLSFLEPELLELTPEIFADYAAQNEGLQLYGFMMEGLFEQKNHIFNQQIEEILSKMGALGNSFEKIYDDLKNYLNAVQESGVAMSVKDGVLASEHDGKWYVMIRGVLSKKGAALASKDNGDYNWLNNKLYYYLK